MADGASLEQTPADRRRQKVRDSILSAAERVFAEDGEAGLSIRRLAEEIDYSPAAIYKYFGSKTELLDELKEAFFGRILSKIGEMRESDLDYPARVRLCLSTYIRTALEKPHHYAAAFGSVDAELDADPSPDAPDSRKMLAFAYLAEMLQEGVETGHFRRDIDARKAAKSVWASCHGLAMMMAHLTRFPAMPNEPDTGGRDDFINYHTDLLIRGLEAAPQ